MMLLSMPALFGLKDTARCPPDEECGGDQHHGEVHSDGGLEVERLEVGGGVADAEEEEGGKVGGQ